jgi:6-phosphogluconolactonase
VLKDGKLGEASAVDQHTGHGPNPEHQEGPHAHQIDVSRDNRFALNTDLGLDQVLVYRFDAAKGTLAANDPPFAEGCSGCGAEALRFPSRQQIRLCDRRTGFDGH